MRSWKLLKTEKREEREKGEGDNFNQELQYLTGTLSISAEFAARIPLLHQPVWSWVGWARPGKTYGGSLRKREVVMIHAWFLFMSRQMDRISQRVPLEFHLQVSFLFVTVLLRRDLHSIQFTYIKCTVQWFLIFTGLCGHRHNFTFSSSQKETS